MAQIQHFDIEIHGESVGLSGNGEDWFCSPDKNSLPDLDRVLAGVLARCITSLFYSGYFDGGKVYTEQQIKKYPALRVNADGTAYLHGVNGVKSVEQFSEEILEAKIEWEYDDKNIVIGVNVIIADFIADE